MSPASKATQELGSSLRTSATLTRQQQRRTPTKYRRVLRHRRHRRQQHRQQRRQRQHRQLRRRQRQPLRLLQRPGLRLRRDHFRRRGPARRRIRGRDVRSKEIVDSSPAQPGSKDPGCALSGERTCRKRPLLSTMCDRSAGTLEKSCPADGVKTDARAALNIYQIYRIPESHSHWTFVILPDTTSASNGPKWPTPDFLPLRETL